MIGIDLPFEVAALAIAAVLFYLFYAARPLFEPLLQSLADNIPLIGGAISGALGTIIGGVESHARSWADDAATPLARTIASVPVALSQLGLIIILVLRALAAQSGTAAQGAISTAVGAVAGTIGAAVALLQSQLATLTDLAIPALQANINYIGSEGLRLYQEAGAATAAAIDGLRGDIEQRIAALAGSIDGAVSAAEQRLLGQIQGIEAGVTSSLDRLIAGIRGEVQSIADGLGRRVGAVEGVIEQTIPGIESQFGALTGELAQTATLAQETARTLTKEIEECIDPLCETIKPEIPNIQAALGLLQLGILATLITDAIVEPIPAAHRTDALVAGPTATVLNALFDPLGVR